MRNSNCKLRPQNQILFHKVVFDDFNQVFAIINTIDDWLPLYLPGKCTDTTIIIGVAISAVNMVVLLVILVIYWLEVMVIPIPRSFIK